MCARRGDTFAAEVNDNGEVIAVAGPLHHLDVKAENLPRFDYKNTDALWLLCHALHRVESPYAGDRLDQIETETRR